MQLEDLRLEITNIIRIWLCKISGIVIESYNKFKCRSFLHIKIKSNDLSHAITFY